MLGTKPVVGLLPRVETRPDPFFPLSAVPPLPTVVPQGLALGSRGGPIRGWDLNSNRRPDPLPSSPRPTGPPPRSPTSPGQNLFARLELFPIPSVPDPHRRCLENPNNQYEGSVKTLKLGLEHWDWATWTGV